jgi:hypothetical protein
MTDEEMQVLITKARRVAGVLQTKARLLGHDHRRRGAAARRPVPALAEIIETMLIMTVGTAAARQANLGVTEAILRPVPQCPEYNLGFTTTGTHTFPVCISGAISSGPLFRYKSHCRSSSC